MRKKTYRTHIYENIVFILMIFLSFIVPNASAEMQGSMEKSGAAMQIIAYLLGMSGSIYLAAILWNRGNKGSESWKQLSIAMMLFGLWNIIMIFNIMMLALYQDPDNINPNFEIAFFAFRILDPILEVMVFLILFFGLNTIIRKMRHSPWVLFDKVEEHDE